MVFEGSVEGTISVQATGEGGLHWHPVFIPAGQTRTFAEMSTEEGRDGYSGSGGLCRHIFAEAYPQLTPQIEEISEWQCEVSRQIRLWCPLYSVSQPRAWSCSRTAGTRERS